MCFCRILGFPGKWKQFQTCPQALRSVLLPPLLKNMMMVPKWRTFRNVVEGEKKLFEGINFLHTQEEPLKRQHLQRLIYSVKLFQMFDVMNHLALVNNLNSMFCEVASTVWLFRSSFWELLRNFSAFVFQLFPQRMLKTEKLWNGAQVASIHKSFGPQPRDEKNLGI